MAETLATAPDIPPGLLQKLSQLSQHVSLWLIVAHLERGSNIYWSIIELLWGTSQLTYWECYYDPTLTVAINNLGSLLPAQFPTVVLYN